MSGKAEKGKHLPGVTADQLMRRDPVTFHRDSSGRALANHLVERWSGAATIVDQQDRPVGIVTEYDLLNALQAGKDLDSIKASEIMTQPVTVSEKTPGAEILDILVTGHLIHLPVVNHEEKLIGLIERRDVLSGYLKSKGST